MSHLDHGTRLASPLQFRYMQYLQPLSWDSFPQCVQLSSTDVPWACCLQHPGVAMANWALSSQLCTMAFQDLPVKNPALLPISRSKSCFRTSFWHPLEAPITPHSWIFHVCKTTWTMLPRSVITLRCSLPLLCRNYSDLWGLWQLKLGKCFPGWLFTIRVHIQLHS